MFEYQATILSSEAAANGTVHMDCRVQRREVDPVDPENNPWIDVPSGHRTVVLGALEIQNVLNSELTTQEKRQAIIQLIRREVKTWGIDEADQAEQGLMVLIPSGSWPVSVPLG